MNVLPPTPTPFAPAPITTTTGKSNLAAACPFLNPATPLCCGDDNAAIMKANYQSLDAVFFSDCPICATNLKYMWCEYACNPLKADFCKLLTSINFFSGIYRRNCKCRKNILKR